MLRLALGVVGAGAFALAWSAPVAAADAALIEKGKKVYETAMPKCVTCHSIGDTGNKKGPLDDVGDRLSAEDIKAWHRSPKEMTAKSGSTRKPPMPPYPAARLSDADLDALTAYMLSLKKK